MQHTHRIEPLDLPQYGSNPAFNVVIAYEDFETGKHAKRTYDFLVENLGHDCEFINQMWKFEVLKLPKLREIASADAMAADIVVISCHGDELPGEVKAWIESWLSAAGKPIALVALFDSSGDTFSRTRAVRDYLEGIAARGSMAFFAQPDEWRRRRNGADSLTGLHERALDQRALSTLAGAVRQDFSAPRWEAGE